MDWIKGIQRAIDYMEDHITEQIDYDAVAKQAFSSSYHFQRTFSILCGYTLGEYLRMRRLSLAGAELAAGSIKVIDAAMKYGYESPDSFTKAFLKFHGVTPSQARSGGVRLNNFSRLSIKITLEGGSIMHYKLEEKPALNLLGYKRRFTGSRVERWEQDENFALTTRPNQFILDGLAHDRDVTYEVLTNFGDDGYDCYIACQVAQEWEEIGLEHVLGEDFKRFERIAVPAGHYLVCQTEQAMYPMELAEELHRKAVTEWLPSLGFELADAPEVTMIYWPFKRGDETVNNSRYVELWLPVKKKNG